MLIPGGSRGVLLGDFWGPGGVASEGTPYGALDSQQTLTFPQCRPGTVAPRHAMRRPASGNADSPTDSFLRTPITFIIVPKVNNRSAPGQKHGHRGKSSFFHQISSRKKKNEKSQRKVLSFCRVVGFWGAVPGGGPGGVLFF